MPGLSNVMVFLMVKVFPNPPELIWVSKKIPEQL